ncbi:MAG: molybdopterin molybdotransferase MoeA, partial [Deltaproteobacteria bacterium]|nr:molybdopterin molybdotransferase MoeA [Deltaproteobacteria bacterium]
MKEKISVAEAQEIILNASPRLGGETLGFSAAQGRILAEPITAGRTLPPLDNSAMDGYALRSEDIKAAAPGSPVSLPVVFEVPAGGQGPRPLVAGEAARIFTGAPVPLGADTVVEQEVVEARKGRACFQAAAPLGQHIRRAGEDVKAGDVVLQSGTQLGPGHLGLLASVGRTFVHVNQRPRVALLSSGDELVEPDGDPTGGRIVSSNSYSLAAQCRELGVETNYLGIAGDTPESVEAHLRAGLSSDILITSAGVSVGDHDHVRPLLEKLGCKLLFWGVRMKPGFPVTFGQFEPGQGPLVFGLPGNPVSAMVCFEQ